jgi:6-pyruvoyltetrahydropterin/6-carboxytetrahydropterin synthase
MYEIAVRQHFDAAHFLRGYRGKCEALHGHRFEVVLKVNARVLNEIGIAYDFVELKEILNRVLARLDHTCLNDLAPFDKINPSSENIAATVYGELKPMLAGVPISGIEVWESPVTMVSYRPD